MCGRYTLTYEKLVEIEEFLNAVDRGDLVQEYNNEPFSDYNIAPSRFLPVVYADKNDQRVIDFMYWGYTKPFYPGADKIGTNINARDDKLASSGYWASSFKKRRCIIPANGFYEWAGKKGNKTPHYIYSNQDEPFMAFAGIFSNYLSEKTGMKKSFAIITTSPNKVVENLHDRMPAILHPSEFDDWLNPDNQDPNYLLDLIRPYPDDAIDEHIVSKAVGNVRNNDKSLIQKADLFG